MSKSATTMIPFQVVGQFLGFVLKDGYKVKYLRISVDKREYWFKPEKTLRDHIPLNIALHSWLKVTGESSLCSKKGKLKLRVLGIEHLSGEKTPEVTPAKAKKATVLICQKSDCWKNGGARVCQRLESSLEEKGLGEAVNIKLTGCLKQCKKGPNLVVMPDKKHYNQVAPQDVPSLIERHFATSEQENTVSV
ncbi:MAG: (2Fe-2S) ferredoxin domain-containing protein [Microcystis aeruginosa W13-18]|jgi:(2Fe-2S) ferredoxin|uniref:Iron-sulfur cluster-binding protein like n=2 Tax=Microcystis aeruginosa TaxID=1126 RepID=A0A9P3DET5_MICAE|nr:MULTISPECIES: (2Fe-2S) ferredoxin domain-containing protein [Microcystis]NCQ83659.1 (2Fe-2S) ferredoxin domain-containing protein [Microcystis aeruginosa W13-18]NCR36626.1 (2Fe-2S) ferredoxin domain-containing protein [Microcystis aeruginosa S11-05]NCR50141.1 (2Fe-2S) ferredoxin domain-containing protein [Microcystis aeruginosa S11-01]ELP52749.1 iron-sulfur cluster-binding protein like protein [Microcystis aeruginosa TAIHU98]MDB9406729.1 (2Fe-2S) ferredoxin domain-containing protein [Microc